ncbi:hypothetical protein A7982_13285 [Minicystis rosea]|nr:hypothetical protein A7982_13285 [Minicystis rosea]
MARHVAKRLLPPLALGAAVVEMCEAQLVDNDRDNKRLRYQGNELTERPPTFEEARIARDVVKAAERVRRVVDQIVSLTTVDGAVIMSNALEVLAFGAKLPARTSLDNVHTVDRDRQYRTWHLEQRGTHHRAAASFASGHSDRIAFIVSQDGDAATFQELDGNLCHWPF